MSNSIWKTPDQKPDSRKQILIYDGVDYSIEISHPEYWEDKGLVEKWCYVDDLIAQADKAERLQKAVEYVYKLLLEETNFTAGVHLPNKYQQKIFEVIRQATKENQ